MTYMKTVDGVDYISIEEREPCGCDGCVSFGDIRLCAHLNDYPEQDDIGTCLNFNIIWIIKEEDEQNVG